MFKFTAYASIHAFILQSLSIVPEYQHMLLLYSNVYFITSKFGLYGFSVYKIVWFGILSQLMESDDSCTFVTQQLKPSSGTTHAQKSKVAYYFLVIEQLMKVLDNNVVEEVLNYLKLYPMLKFLIGHIRA